MDDRTLLALCAFEEANLEPDDGVAAVARVILNRMARRFQSDGTVTGTVLHPNAFSWTAWSMIGGHYVKVAHTPAEVAERAAALLGHAEAYPKSWARILAITDAVLAGDYRGAAYDRLTADTVSYDNLAIAQPAWATPDKLVCAIGHHSFFRA